MKFELIYGAIGEADDLLAVGENWLDLVRSWGLEPYRYARFCGPMADGYTYIDFGSWCYFVRTKDPLDISSKI